MIDWRQKIDDEIAHLSSDLVKIRRYLHSHPDPSREEQATAHFVGERLSAAGLEVKSVLGGRGLIAHSTTENPHPCIALRADMDALWIQDRKEVSYRSTRDGVMHACGHDAHTAIVMGAALALHRCELDLPFPISWRAIFQPAEEVGEGAREMVEAGAVEGVDSILALHVAPDLPTGSLALRDGVMTAYCQAVQVTIRGLGGHGARPHLAHDPIAAAAQFLNLVYQSIPRFHNAHDPVVVSFGSIHGGNSPNVIPDLVQLNGTIRTLGSHSAEKVRERLSQIASGVTQTSHCPFEVTFDAATDAVENDPRVSKVCRTAAAEVVGPDQVKEIPVPSMGGEDFSGYLKRVPGCLLRLGVAGDSTWPLLHSPHFDIDETAIALGARVLARSLVLLASGY